MKSSIYQLTVSVLLLSCFAACHQDAVNHDEPSNPVTPAKSIQKPDSAYRYNIASDGTETLAVITYYNYTYDEAGNLIYQQDSTAAQIGVGFTKHKTDMKYDAKGNLIEKTDASCSSQNTNWIYGICRRWTYDEKNRIATIFLYENDKALIAEHPVKKGIYSWQDDTHAECLGYKYYAGYAPGTESWGVTEKCVYTYNMRGAVVAEFVYTPANNDSWALWCSYDYTYDEYGNVTSRIYKEKDVFILQEYNKYEYDSAGNILVWWYSSSTDETPPADPTAKYVYFY